MRAAIERAMHNVSPSGKQDGCSEITSEGKWHASIRDFRRKRFVFAFLCYAFMIFFVCSNIYIIDLM